MFRTKRARLIYTFGLWQYSRLVLSKKVTHNGWKNMAKARWRSEHYEFTGRFSRPLKTGIPVKWTRICQRWGRALNRFSCSWNRNPVTSNSGIPVPQWLWQMWRSNRNSGSMSCSSALSAQPEFLYILQQDFWFMCRTRNENSCSMDVVYMLQTNQNSCSVTIFYRNSCADWAGSPVHW